MLGSLQKQIDMFQWRDQANHWARIHDKHRTRAQLPKGLEAMYDAWFGAIDVDKGGTINAQELANAMSSSGLPAEQKVVTAFISLMDSDSSGEVDLEEFKDFTCTQMTRGNAVNEFTLLLPDGEVQSLLPDTRCWRNRHKSHAKASTIGVSNACTNQRAS
jgi:hypothetical protein